MAHKYTKEQAKFIEKNIKGTRTNMLTEMFNKKFETQLETNQIRAYVKNHDLKSGVDSTFKKGRTPHNKGMKGICSEGCKKTWFKKGCMPVNHRPVGSERINIYGYTEIKIKEPNKWRLKHQVVWEEHKGSIPDGYVVIFGDGNKSNFDISNLVLVSKQQLLTLNRNNLIQNDADLTRTAVIIADICQKINQRKAKSRRK